jgi:hypothetical protein
MLPVTKNAGGTLREVQWHMAWPAVLSLPNTVQAKMKVDLHVDQLRVERAYTSLDPIRGSVNLRLWHSTPISEVLLLLKGAYLPYAC